MWVFFHVENEQFFDKCDIQSIVPSQDLTGHQTIYSTPGEIPQKDLQTFSVNSI